MFDFVIKSTPEQIINFSSLFSTLVGGGITLISVCLTNHFNNDRTMKVSHENEIATILSIVEELKCLQYAFENEFDYYFSDIKEDTYIEYPITITQDYTTVYTQNVNRIGIIKNEKLRNDIIKTYTLIKKLIDNLLHYNLQIQQLNVQRHSFIKRLYPNFVANKCSEQDLNYTIVDLKKSSPKNIAVLAQRSDLKEQQIINFIKSDKELLVKLIYWSNSMKGFYTEIKASINTIKELSEIIYKGKINERN